MIEKILEYSGIIFAAFGIICLFLESFAAFKRKDHSKLTIAGLVFLSVSVVGFIVTEIILSSLDVSYFFTIAWIVLIWAYIACDITSMMLTSRKNRAEKRKMQTDETMSEASDGKIDEQTEQIEQNVNNKQ